MVSMVEAASKPKLELVPWTKDGLFVLGKVIRSERERQGYSLEDIVNLIEKTGGKLSKKTIGNVENCVGTPQYNTLVLIALARFVKDRYDRPLSPEDFMHIAGGLKFDEYPEYLPSALKQPRIMSLSEMIQRSMQQNGLSQEDVEIQLAQLLDSEVADLSVEKFKAIQHGAIKTATINELRTIQVLVDPDEATFSSEEWEVYLTQNPTNWQGDNNHNNTTSSTCM